MVDDGVNAWIEPNQVGWPVVELVVVDVVDVDAQGQLTAQCVLQRTPVGQYPAPLLRVKELLVTT